MENSCSLPSPVANIAVECQKRCSILKNALINKVFVLFPERTCTSSALLTLSLLFHFTALAQGHQYQLSPWMNITWNVTQFLQADKIERRA